MPTREQQTLIERAHRAVDPARAIRKHDRLELSARMERRIEHEHREALQDQQRR